MHDMSTIALLPLALAAISTALSITYRISQRSRPSRKIQRRLTAAHAFAIEALQIILLGAGLFAGWCVVASKESSAAFADSGLLIESRWPTLLVIIVTYATAILAIDTIDNLVQLGRFQHPLQNQAFLLTRSKLLPRTVKRIRKRVIWELDGTPVRDYRTDVYATPSRPHQRPLTHRRAISASPAGRVAQLVSAFEEDIRRASPQRLHQPEPHLCASPEHDPNLDSSRTIPCPAGCGGLFIDNHYAYQHMLSDHYPWICRLCNPVDVLFLEAAFDRPRSLARHLRVVHGLIWRYPEYPPVSRTITMPQTKPLGEINYQDPGEVGFSPTRRVQQQPLRVPSTPPNPRRVQFTLNSEETGHSTPATTPPTPASSPIIRRFESEQHLAFLEADGQSNGPVEPNERAATDEVFSTDTTVFNPSSSALMPSQGSLPAETVDLFPTKDHCRSTGPVAARHTAERLKQRNMKVVSKDM